LLLDQKHKNKSQQSNKAELVKEFSITNAKIYH